MSAGDPTQSPATPETPRADSENRQPFKKRLSNRAEDLILEGVGTAIAVCIISLTDHLVKLLIGDGKFFDFIPVQWVFDAAHIVVVCRLIWGVIRRFNDEE